MSGSVAPKIVKDGLVLYLDAANVKSYTSLLSPWLDISKNKNNGTFINGPTFSSANGGSIVFDGINDYVSCGNDSSILFLNNSPYTIATFSKIINFRSNYPSWIRRESVFGGIRNGYNLLYTILGQASNEVYVYTERFSTSGAAGAGGTINRSVIQSNWAYISATYDGLVLKIYVNGELLGQNNSPGLITNTAQSLLLGFPGFGSYNNCNIATINVYNRALSINELKQNYNALKSRYL